MGKPQPIQISHILIDRGTQMRAEVNESVVADYHERLMAVKSWPFDSPLVVFFDGKKYYLADGFHRYFAAKRCNRVSAPCEVIEGTLRDAIKYALGANANHGLRRTNEDKRTAVTHALSDKEWSQLSSRQIAEMCGVTHPFVEKVRAGQVVTVTTSKTKNAVKDDVSETAETRKGSDGKNYPVKEKPVSEPEPEPKSKASKTEKPDGSSTRKKPKADKPQETPKQQAASMKKMIKDHNAAMMRIVDDLHKLVPNKTDHQRIVQMFRAIHNIAEGWR